MRARVCVAVCVCVCVGVHTIVGALALMAIMVANVAQAIDPTAVPGMRACVDAARLAHSDA